MPIPKCLPIYLLIGRYWPVEFSQPIYWLCFTSNTSFRLNFINFLWVGCRNLKCVTWVNSSFNHTEWLRQSKTFKSSSHMFPVLSWPPLSSDLNECLNQTVCGPGRCVNTEGSYRCNCFQGYQLSVDNFCQGNSQTLILSHIEVTALWIVLHSAATEASRRHSCYMKRLQRVSGWLYFPEAPFFLPLFPPSRCGWVRAPRSLSPRPLCQSGRHPQMHL